MPVKVSSKGQVVLPAELRKKYGIEAGENVEILDFGGEIVIVPVPKTKGRGFLKFRGGLEKVIAAYKKMEKEKELKK